MDTDIEFEKTLSFLKSASEAAVESDKIYEFTCPNCGGKAYAGRAKRNGHIHAQCDGCHVKLME